MKFFAFAFAALVCVGCSQVPMASNRPPAWLQSVSVADIPAPAPEAKPEIPDHPGAEAFRRRSTELVKAEAESSELREKLAVAEQALKEKESELEKCLERGRKAAVKGWTGIKVFEPPVGVPCVYCEKWQADFKKHAAPQGWTLGTAETNHFMIVRSEKPPFPRFEVWFEGKQVGDPIIGYDGSDDAFKQILFRHPVWTKKPSKDGATWVLPKKKSGQGMASVDDVPPAPGYESTRIEKLQDELEELKAKLKEKSAVEPDEQKYSWGHEGGPQFTFSYTEGSGGARGTKIYRAVRSGWHDGKWYEEGGKYGFDADGYSYGCGGSYSVAASIPTYRTVYTTSCGGSASVSPYAVWQAAVDTYGFGSSCSGGYSYTPSYGYSVPSYSGWGGGFNMGGFSAGIGGGMRCDPRTGVCWY